MAWELPITVDGQTFTARFDSAEKPTDEDIADVVEHLKDPARGQSLGEGMAANLEQGFSKGMTGTFLTGPGAVLEAVGFEDNTLLREGRKVDKEIEARAPISRENQERFPVKAAGAIGQMGSMVLTAPLAGAGAVKGAGLLANFFARTRQLAMMGGFQGAAAGEEEAVRLGITDPLAKAGMVFGYGAAEAVSEKLGGYGVETGLMRALRGDLPTGQIGKRILTGGVVEGFEEVGAGVPQRGISKALATEDPNRPGFTPAGQPIHNAWDVGAMIEEFSLGAVAGGTMVGVTNVFNSLTPQQQQDSKNVAHLPGPLRGPTYNRLQAVRTKNAAALSMSAGLDEATKSALRLVGDGAAAKVLGEADQEAATEFAEGWKDREKANLMHTGEQVDAWFDGKQWVTKTGENANGQPIFGAAPNATELDAARQEWIKTGVMPEGMQPLAEFDDGITPEVLEEFAAQFPTVTPAELDDAITQLKVLPQTAGVVKMTAMVEAEKARRQAAPTPATSPTPAATSPSTPAAAPAAKPIAGGDTVITPHGSEAVVEFVKGGAASVRITKSAHPDEADGASGIMAVSSLKPVVPQEAPAENTSAQEPQVQPPASEAENVPQVLTAPQAAEKYPNSPDLVQRLSEAQSPVAAAVILREGEPVAQLREELAGQTPMEVADRMRAAGADEVTVVAATEGGQVDLVTAADLISTPIPQETPQTEEPDPVVTDQRTTARFQPDEFEARLREKIRELSLPGWTDVAIERALDYHRTHNPADLPFRAAREFVEDIEREMQTPGEQRQSAAEARRGVLQRLLGVLDPARPDRIPATAQAELDALPESTTAQDFIDGIAPRVMDWAMRTQRQVKNFAAFLKAGMTKFGARFKGFAQRLWTAVQVMIVGAVGFTGTTSQQADARALAAAPIDPAPIAKVAIIQPNVAALPEAKPVGIDPKEIEDFAPTTQPEAGFSPVIQPPPPLSQTEKLAAWVAGTNDNQGQPFAIADKMAGTLSVYDGNGKLLHKMPALFGKERGDVRRGEGSRVTPAGRFAVNQTDIGPYISEKGVETSMGTAIDVVDTGDSSIAIHRLSLHDPSEMREERLESRDPGDNRISWGCINLSTSDMDRRMLPAFENGGFVYIMPETPRGMKSFDGFRRMLDWADRVVAEGNLNVGLNPRLLAAHAIRSADWILTNGRNFGKWAAEQISRFGEAIRSSLRRIWSAATEFLRGSGQLPPLTPADEAGRIAADEPANRAQRSAPAQSRRIGSVSATVARIGEAAGVELLTHSETDTPIVSVVHGDGGTTVSVHERYAAAVAALNGAGRVEELTKLASFLALQRAISGAAVRPVPAWLTGVTRQELLMREVAAALSGTSISIRDLWTAGLEVMMGRQFESTSQRDAALLSLRADLADPQVAEGWFNHLLRLASERQAGQLAEQRGGLFEASPKWRQRVLKTLDDFLARARAAEYGPDVQRVLEQSAATYQDAAVATATAMIEGELINRQIQRDADQEIHSAGDTDLAGRAVSPYRLSIGEAAAAMAGETDVRFVSSAREALPVRAVRDGAPFGIDADGTAVVVLDQVHVTLNDRRRAEKAGTTAGEQALRRVVREAEAAAEEAALNPQQQLARAMVGEVVNAMQATDSWAPFVNALWNEYGPELQQMVAGSTTEARGEQARTDSPSYDRQQRATRVRDRDQAATVWLIDNFGAQMEQVLMGERARTEPLTALTGRFAQATEDFVRQSLEPYLRGTAVRYSVQEPLMRQEGEGGASAAPAVPGPVSMPQSAVNVLYGSSELLPKPQKKVSNSVVAGQLAEVATKYWGDVVTSETMTPEQEAEITQNATEEFKAALAASGKNAADWYSTAIERAMAIAAVLHPELSSDAEASKVPAFAAAKSPAAAARLALRIAMAITSQNLNVSANAKYAEEQFEAFKATGKFDPSRKYGDKALSISSNLALANDLVELFGFDEAERFIRDEFTVDSLEKAASKLLGRKIKIAGLKSDMVNGAALFGPKIGQGFLQNLLSNFMPVTIDLWMRRTWGRWTGDVIGDGVTEERMARLIDAARAAGIPLPTTLGSLRPVTRERGNGNPYRTMSEAVSERLEEDPEFRNEVSDLARDLNARWQGQYRLLRMPMDPATVEAVRNGEMTLPTLVKAQQRTVDRLNSEWSARRGGEKVKKEDWVQEQHDRAGRTETLTNDDIGALKPDWAHASKVIVAQLNPIDVPSPQDRRTITRIVNKVRENLVSQGYTTTNADIQAVLWYPEKDIWAKLRGESESNLKLSYDDEFLKIAESRGLGSEARAAAGTIRSSGAARAGVEAVPGTAEGTPAGAQQPAQPAGGARVVRNSAQKVIPGRSGEVQQALQDRLEGKITQEQYDAIVQANKPIAPLTEVPVPATHAEMADPETGVVVSSIPKVGKANEIPAGKMVALRTDLPWKKKTGKAAVVIHEKKGSMPGQVLAFEGTGRILNPQFLGKEEKAAEIGAGAGRSPFAAVHGAWSADQSIPADVMTWTQVGFDPTRHSYYFDKATRQPVIGGSEAIQIGNTVFVKDAQFGSTSDVMYSAQAPQPIVVARRVSTAAAERARAGLLSISPTAGGAWIGNRAQLNAHLLSSPKARNAWELGWRLDAENANATKAQADEAFRNWVELGLDQMEGFSLGGRTYLIADQVFVYDTDGSEEMAARRVLLHEDAHETLQHLRDVDPEFDAQWVAYRNQVPAAELDDLVSRYPWMANWRSNPSTHDDIFHEWMAHKAAEVEYRGMPASDSLFGQIMQWLRSVWQSLVGGGAPPSDQQILAFLDASRAAKWKAVAAGGGFRYSANSDGDASARQIDGDINGSGASGAPLETQQRYANDQVLGQIMGTTHAVQHLAPMRQFARFWLGGAHGDRAPVNPENTETAKQLAQEFLSSPQFARDYIDNFQEWYEETNPDAVPHAGDAAVAMLQIELMDYGARLAAQGDPSLMLRLLPSANEAHVGDVNTVEGSARVLQARSATTQNVIYDVLKDFLAGALHAAAGVDKLGTAVEDFDADGKPIAGEFVRSVDPTLNGDLARDLALGMDEYAESDGIDSEAEEFDDLAEKFEPEAWRDRARELLDPEFRKMDIRLETVMIRLAELQTLRLSLKAKASSAAKASIAAEDRQRFATDPAALDAEIAALTAEATELLSRLSKPATSHETKGKRRDRLNNPKVAAAKKLLSADEQAKKYLERYESRNKRVRRDKEQWQKVLEDQIRNPVDEDVFRANAVEAGIEVETADQIFEVAAQISAERRAKVKPKAAKPDRSAEKTKKEMERYYAAIEKAEGKEAAAQAKLATQQAKARAKAQNRATAAEQQREAQEAKREEERKEQKRKADLEAYYAEIEREEGRVAAVQAKLANEKARERAKAEKQRLADLRQEQRDEAAAARAAEKAARELNKVQKEVEDMIDDLAKQFSDTPSWKKSNPSKWRELRRQFREQIIDRAEFLTGMQALNVKSATANQIADLTEEEFRRQDTVAEARARQAEEARKSGTTSTAVTKPRLSYRDLITFVGKALIATPLSQQGDPKWVEETFIAAFQDMGFPRDIAQRYAAKISMRYQSVLKAAQIKQMEKAAKTLGIKKLTLERVAKWIRSGVFNPMVANPVIAGLMKEAGYAPMSQADFTTLAELDDAINSGFATLSAEAFTKIQRILRQLRPHKHWNPMKEGSVWAQVFVNGALSSLGVFSLNWLHTAYIMPRRLVTDLGSMLGDTMIGAGKGGRAENLKLMANMFNNLWEARRNFLNQAIQSLATDSYKGRMLEMLNTEHELHTELMQAIEDAKSGSASERLLAIPKIAWLSGDWVRRMLASADQTWGSVIQRYVIRNEAMRMMVQDAGLTVEGAALVVQQAVEEGAAMSSNLETAGMDSRRAALIGEDQMMKTLYARLDAMAPLQRGKMKGGELLRTTVEKESGLELGNRRGETSPSWDIPNVLLEGFKSAASAVRKQSELIGRPLTGFVSVGANLLNRSFYFTPLGALRVLAKKSMNEADRQKYYSETMATQGQMRARLYESIAGTIMLMILEIFRWRPEDKEWGIEVTGNGPQTPALREAWYKGGNKKGSIQLKDGEGNVIFGVSYTRGGLDHMAIPLTFAGAHSDMDLEGKRSTPKDVNWAWAYTQTVGGNIVKNAQFFGAKALFGGMPTSTKPHALAGLVAYNVQPFLPWGGLQRSTWKMLSGPTEEGSWRSAVASNIPVAQVFLGTPKPAINFLGDQLGNEPTEAWKKMLDRGAGQGFPPFLVAMDPTPQNEQIYDFLMRKGVAPTTPLRSYLENKNGFLTDDKWYTYVKTRGALIKAELLREMPRLNLLRGRDLEREISSISSDATKKTKEKMGLE